MVKAKVILGILLLCATLLVLTACDARGLAAEVSLQSDAGAPPSLKQISSEPLSPPSDANAPQSSPEPSSVSVSPEPTADTVTSWAQTPVSPVEEQQLYMEMLQTFGAMIEFDQ